MARLGILKLATEADFVCITARGLSQNTTETMKDIA